MVWGMLAAMERTAGGISGASVSPLLGNQGISQVEENAETGRQKMDESAENKTFSYSPKWRKSLLAESRPPETMRKLTNFKPWYYENIGQSSKLLNQAYALHLKMFASDVNGNVWSYNIMPGVELLAICLHILALEATQPPSPALKVNAVASKKFNCNLQGGNLKERAPACCLPRIHIAGQQRKKGYFQTLFKSCNKITNIFCSLLWQNRGIILIWGEK